MNVDRIRQPFSLRFRAKRMRALAKRFALTDETTVLDIGGSMFNWDLIPIRPRLTIVNLSEAPAALPAGVRWVIGDGTALPFTDGSFDLCYSNSVIEHLPSLELQRRLAGEIVRVGRAYYVQTPNRWFPIESHVIAPFIHWFPRSTQVFLVRWFSVWGLAERPDLEACRTLIDGIRLLDASEMARLFPDAEIIDERWAGLRKSVIAVA